jgi:hypothetical protein
VLGASRIKCDSGSQLNTVIEANAASSLRILSEKIGGSSCASNGHAMRLNAVFTPNPEIRADGIVAAILHQRPLLMEWKGALYVIHGVIYDEHLHNSGKRDNVIRQLLLIDPRYSDQRRFASFDRQRDEFAQVNGITEIQVAAP